MAVSWPTTVFLQHYVSSKSFISGLCLAVCGPISKWHKQMHHEAKINKSVLKSNETTSIHLLKWITHLLQTKDLKNVIHFDTDICKTLIKKKKKEKIQQHDLRRIYNKTLQAQKVQYICLLRQRLISSQKQFRFIMLS